MTDSTSVLSLNTHQGEGEKREREREGGSLLPSPWQGGGSGTPGTLLTPHPGRPSRAEATGEGGRSDPVGVWISTPCVVVSPSENTAEHHLYGGLPPCLGPYESYGTSSTWAIHPTPRLRSLWRRSLYPNPSLLRHASPTVGAVSSPFRSAVLPARGRDQASSPLS